MDPIVSGSLSEICAQGANKILLTDLSPTLDQSLTSSGFHLCTGVKPSIWNGLLSIHGLQFQSQTSTFSFQNPSIQSFQDAETKHMNIVASQHQRDCFVGLYEGDSGISKPQQRDLEHLAIASLRFVLATVLLYTNSIKGGEICAGLLEKMKEAQ